MLNFRKKLPNFFAFFSTLIVLSGSLIFVDGKSQGISAYQPATTYILATAPVQHPNGSVINETIYYQTSDAIENPQAQENPTGSYYSNGYYSPSTFTLQQTGGQNIPDLAPTYSQYSYATQPAPENWRNRKRHPYHPKYEISGKKNKHKNWGKSYYKNHMKNLMKKKSKKRGKISYPGSSSSKYSKYNPMLNKWGDRQDLDYEAESDDEENLFDYPDFLFSGLDMEDLMEGEDSGDLLFGGGDEEDPFAEETFQRPSIIGLQNGIRLASSGINSGLAEAFPGMGFPNDMKRFFGVGLPFGPRFLLKKLGFGFKIFVALMILPLILLFLPIPILNNNTTTNSRNKDESGANQGVESHPILEYGRRMLKSENCIERISCEIHNFEQVTGMESTHNNFFSQVMAFVNNFNGFFPTFLGRMARGYTMQGASETCQNFQCNSLKSHLIS